MRILQRLEGPRFRNAGHAHRITTAAPSYVRLTVPLRVHSSVGREAEVGAKRHRGSSSRLLVPAEDTQRPERVPPAGPAVAVLESKVDPARMRVLQQPGAIGLLLGSEQID